MGFYAEVWLRRAREGIGGSPGAEKNEIAAADFEKIAAAVEKAIKAALIESHGSIPERHDHTKLVAVCESTGVWGVLPPVLKSFVQEVEAYRNAGGAPDSGRGGPARTADFARSLTVARRLIDYMEHHVIGNDSVLKRLTVS